MIEIFYIMQRVEEKERNTNNTSKILKINCKQYYKLNDGNLLYNAKRRRKRRNK